MISFTVKVTNSPTGLEYWAVSYGWPIPGQEWGGMSFSPTNLPIGASYTFYQVGTPGGLSWDGRDAAGRYVMPGSYQTEPYDYKNGATYVIDWSRSIIEEVEAPPEEELPTWAKGVAMFWPWSPLFGPPLPKGFFPPWPMWMSRWTEIPGYPKAPESVLTK